MSITHVQYNAGFSIQILETPSGDLYSSSSSMKNLSFGKFSHRVSLAPKSWSVSVRPQVNVNNSLHPVPTVH